MWFPGCAGSVRPIRSSTFNHRRCKKNHLHRLNNQGQAGAALRPIVSVSKPPKESTQRLTRTLPVRRPSVLLCALCAGSVSKRHFRDQPSLIGSPEDRAHGHHRVAKLTAWMRLVRARERDLQTAPCVGPQIGHRAPPFVSVCAVPSVSHAMGNLPTRGFQKPVSPVQRLYANGFLEFKRGGDWSERVCDKLLT